MENKCRIDNVRWHVKIYKRLPYIFVLAFTISDIKILNILPSKIRSRSWSIIFALTLFDGKYQNL